MVNIISISPKKSWYNSMNPEVLPHDSEMGSHVKLVCDESVRCRRPSDNKWEQKGLSHSFTSSESTCQEDQERRERPRYKGWPPHRHIPPKQDYHLVILPKYNTMSDPSERVTPVRPKRSFLFIPFRFVLYAPLLKDRFIDWRRLLARDPSDGHGSWPGIL